MIVDQLGLPEAESPPPLPQQGSYQVEATLHANWAAENGERLCEGCYSLGASRVVKGKVLCAFCADHQKGMKL